jgi:hypothetical protein
MGQADCSNRLAHLLLEDNQLDAAEDAASRSIDFIPENGNKLVLCQSIVPLGLYIAPRETKRRPFTISRRPSNLHPVSTGRINWSWRFCLFTNTSSIMHRPTSNEQSHTRPKTDTNWVAQWKGRLLFGINKVDLKTHNPRSWARSRSLRRLGRRWRWGAVGISFETLKKHWKASLPNELCQSTFPPCLSSSCTSVTEPPYGISSVCVQLKLLTMISIRNSELNAERSSSSTLAQGFPNDTAGRGEK